MLPFATIYAIFAVQECLVTDEPKQNTEITWTVSEREDCKAPPSHPLQPLISNTVSLFIRRAMAFLLIDALVKILYLHVYTSSKSPKFLPTLKHFFHREGETVTISTKKAPFREGKVAVPIGKRCDRFLDQP